jgi:hypothetical protein
VTDLAALILTVQVLPDTASHPVHPVNAERRFGDAVSVTTVVLEKDAAHVDPQLIPAGLEVTVPLPRPVLLTLRVKNCRLNVAVTVLAPLMVTVHAAPDTASQPVQPANSEPLAAAAVKVTVVPLL